ncbi:hypothetical protein Q3V23_23325 [Streptomyces sp. VNUA116]|uniref:hypothetical protein n=1 Tax=Streptomyces sp. VNUA116 TaxID=3062449 RepID=UPI002676C0EC|nr:hypothetical protein [Streptomyces sp. VNUA116]WKU46757.1 hypothetical protein Q3V23_23325 [Streptomyces sp. VNUA116]
MGSTVRDAAWQIAFSLNQLAAAHMWGDLPTMPGEHGGLVPGDLDDAWQQFFAHESALPAELVERVRALLERWESDPVGRLVALLPVLDDLALLHGADLPFPSRPPEP